MIKTEKSKGLYKNGKYKEIVEQGADILSSEEDEDTCIYAWSLHQLGRYKESIPVFAILCRRNPPESEIGESARTGLAQGLLQLNGDIAAAEKIMKELPRSLKRDNVIMNMLSKAADKGEEINPLTVVDIVTDALDVPDELWTVEVGHIVNNAAQVLFRARNQKEVRPYFEEMAMLYINIAIGIYRKEDAQKNHIAAALFRKAQIHKELFERAIMESIATWEKLVAFQGGERYMNNLKGAKELLIKK